LSDTAGGSCVKVPVEHILLKGTDAVKPAM